MKMRTAAMVAATTSLAFTLAACSGSSDNGDGSNTPAPESSSTTSDSAMAEVAGEITVLTNRTDLVDTVFADYKSTFEAKYPDVEVKFEAITDYEGEVATRMSTDDYGDVLLIPNSVNASDYPDFFEPLGSVDELSQTYRFIGSEANFDGQSYGIAITGNANGLVYNKKVWADAGVTADPTTPEEFQKDLQMISDNTDATPLYTNYADGWPLTQWESDRGGVTANANAVNELADTDAPWSEGMDHYIIDSLIFDAAAAGNIEEDPTTTNWEQSKTDLGTGKIGAMALGSWAIVQMQEAADDAADIGYMPFPNQVDGTFHSVISGDYKNGINVHSENKAAARAWIDWFADESGYATDQGGISPRLDGPTPDTLKDFDAAGVEYIELTPPPAGQESLVSDIDNAAEIGLWSPDYRQRIVDAARGARDETKQDIFDDLNSKWAEARASVEG
ncbi:ABC transporter substrate-binding protein [Demequina oxidasica]|uniref:ABC transporter substrate-binding protein n=1 Tax=Demequina oxidasica TaxID=676199 RepID=UPI000786285D|nr:extracellular solute-binding protein [Demequina oxidasica]